MPSPFLPRGCPRARAGRAGAGGLDRLAAQLPPRSRGLRQELSRDGHVSPEREGGDGRDEDAQRPDETPDQTPDETQQFDVSGDSHDAEPSDEEAPDAEHEEPDEDDVEEP